MKHFVFHLISVILLIVLFLITLDLTRAKQISQKEIDELTKKCAAAEQTLEKERVDAAAKEEKASADNARIEAEKKDLQDKLAILEESVSEMGRSFQVVSARDVKMLGLTFEQTPRTDADAAAAIELADSVKDATPETFKTAVEATLAPRIAVTRELVLDAESGYVVDPLAAVVETAAKAAKLTASTTVFWDVPRKIFRSEVTVSDPGKKNPSAVVSLGGNSKTFRDVAFQLSPKTTIFPFTDISLLSRTSVDLFTAGVHPGRRPLRALFSRVQQGSVGARIRLPGGPRTRICEHEPAPAHARFVHHVLRLRQSLYVPGRREGQRHRLPRDRRQAVLPRSGRRPPEVTGRTLQSEPLYFCKTRLKNTAETGILIG